MYEKEIQFITDYNLYKIVNLGSSFTLEKLVDFELHPAIIKYISGEYDFLIYRDRTNLLENSLFDYSGGKISGYFNQISEEIKRTRKLSLDHVKRYIEKAVTFNANFTIQPLNNLIDLIFKNEESKDVGEVKVYLNYIYYYDYLRDILNSYFARKKSVSIKKKDFESVIKKIKKELLSKKPQMIISDAIDSIADFYNEGVLNKLSININFIETYLKSENLDKYRIRLNEAYKNSKKKIEIEELKEVLFSLIEEQENVETEIESIEEKNFEDEIEEMNIDKTSDKNEADELLEEVPVKESKFEKDIFSFLSEKETEKIISIVFNDDGEDFTSTMEKLEDCNDYNHAAEVLKKVFSTYKVDPFKREAIALTDAVSDYFHQAD